MSRRAIYKHLVATNDKVRTTIKEFRKPRNNGNRKRSKRA